MQTLSCTMSTGHSHEWAGRSACLPVSHTSHHTARLTTAGCRARDQHVNLTLLRARSSEYCRAERRGRAAAAGPDRAGWRRRPGVSAGWCCALAADSRQSPPSPPSPPALSPPHLTSPPPPVATRRPSPLLPPALAQRLSPSPPRPPDGDNPQRLPPPPGISDLSHGPVNCKSCAHKYVLKHG